MPLVQQERTDTQPSIEDMILGSESVAWWAARDRPRDMPIPETAPAVAPRTAAPPTTERKTPPRRRRVTGISLYELVGQTLALLGTFGIATLIWAIGAYFTLHFLDTWGAQAKLGVLLSTFGMTPSPEMLYWMTRSVPLVMTVIEAFLLPRWNWPWTPTEEQIVPSGWYRWFMFGAVLTPDVGTTAAGLSSWVMGVLGWTGSWSIGAAVVLGIAIAISPEKIGRRALVELKALWSPLITQMLPTMTRRLRNA